MSEYGAVLTRAGLAALLNAEVGDTLVSLTQMAVGDGVPELTGNETELINEVYRFAPEAITRNPEDPTQIIIQGAVPPEIGGFTVREAGVFDANGVLFAIARLAPSVKPVLAQGASNDLSIRFAVAIDNADQLNLQVNPYVAIASAGSAQRRLPILSDGQRKLSGLIAPAQSNGMRTANIDWTGPRTDLPPVIGTQNGPIADNGDGTVTVNFRGRSHRKMRTYNYLTELSRTPTIGEAPFTDGFNNTGMGAAVYLAEKLDGLDGHNLALIGQGSQALHRYDKDDANPFLWDRVTDEAPKALAAWGVEGGFDYAIAVIGESHDRFNYDETENPNGHVTSFSGQLAIAEKVFRQFRDEPGLLKPRAPIIIVMHWTSDTRRNWMNRAWQVLADKYPDLYLVPVRHAVSNDDVHFYNAFDVGYDAIGPAVLQALTGTAESPMLPEQVRDRLNADGALGFRKTRYRKGDGLDYSVSHDLLLGYVHVLRGNIVTLPQMKSGFDDGLEFECYQYSFTSTNTEGDAGSVLRPFGSQIIYDPDINKTYSELVLLSTDTVTLQWVQNRWIITRWFGPERGGVVNVAPNFKYIDGRDDLHFQVFGRVAIDAGQTVRVNWPVAFVFDNYFTFVGPQQGTTAGYAPIQLAAQTTTYIDLTNPGTVNLAAVDFMAFGPMTGRPEDA